MTKKEKPINDFRSLPKGVGVAIHHKDGSVTYVQDKCLEGMRWEGLSVDSSRFRSLTPHEKLWQLAREYLLSAIALCERAGASGTDLNWPQASVIYYCLHLATELFLKACLISAGKAPKSLNHEIANLFREYKKLFPQRDFHFSTPWQFSAKDINAALGADCINGVDRSPDQLFRYHMGKDGKTSNGIQFFTPGYMFNCMTDLETQWSKIWSRLNKKAP